MTENAYKAKAVSDNEVIELLRKHIEANIAMMDLSPKGSEISEFEKRLDAYGTMIDVMKEIQRYRAIGTVEECREAMERQRAKKPRFYAHNYYCGNCGNLVGNDEFKWKRYMYCDKCGHSVLWERDDE